MTLSIASRIFPSMRLGLAFLANPARLAQEALRAFERRRYGETFWNLYPKLGMFTPHVRAAPHQQTIALTFLAAGQSFALLDMLVEESRSCRAQILEAGTFCETGDERAAAGEIKRLFDYYGSDKATAHNYHLIYGPILTRMNSVSSMLEIGLGTNNADVVSNMGAAGKPGASLRAFRDYLPGANVYGADIDRRILFEEERIRTFFIDQTDLSSFCEVETLGNFDLVIDDGLHAPNANLAVLLLGTRRIKVGGWIVIEDIPSRAVPVWKVVGSILPEAYKTSIIQAQDAFVFTAERTR